VLAVLSAVLATLNTLGVSGSDMAVVYGGIGLTLDF